MNRTIFTVLFMVLACCYQPLSAQSSSVPRESEDIMLQAFHWDSYKSNDATINKLGGRTKWIDLMKDTTDLRENFDLIWLPPSAAGGGVGYYPNRWSSQDGDWGSKSNLMLLINALHRGGTRVIADIVCNHHATTSGWGGFTKEDFGTFGSYQLTQADICAGDEAFTDSRSNIKGSSNHGAADTGDNDSGCRDLDHTSENVQNCVKAYVQWMRQVIGYDGFRYDMVKGYHGRYVAMYNRAAQPTFSVGECFDGNLQTLKNYVDAAEKTTMVFDFAAKFNVFNQGIASSNYGGLKATKDNKLHRDPDYGRYAVTFIDNHDTFNRGDGNEYCGDGKGGSLTKKAKILEANAYLLTMPGVPCVFYPHWVTYRGEIKSMMQARRLAGVHSESQIVSEQTGGSYRYEAVIQGHRGKLMLRIGTSRDKTTPEGYTLFTSGDNYHIFVESKLMSVEAVSAPISDTKKVMENGRLVIIKNGARYTVDGMQL